jgi:hypothetical protein
LLLLRYSPEHPPCPMRQGVTILCVHTARQRSCSWECGELQMVSAMGLEPMTYRLKVRCSTN